MSKQWIHIWHVLVNRQVSWGCEPVFTSWWFMAFRTMTTSRWSWRRVWRALASVFAGGESTKWTCLSCDLLRMGRPSATDAWGWDGMRWCCCSLYLSLIYVFMSISIYLSLSNIFPSLSPSLAVSLSIAVLNLSLYLSKDIHCIHTKFSVCLPLFNVPNP